jgi:hypothetical protein
MAAQMRQFSERETVPTLKEKFEALAKEYDKLAERAEERSGLT